MTATCFVRYLQHSDDDDDYVLLLLNPVVTSRQRVMAAAAEVRQLARSYPSPYHHHLSSSWAIWPEDRSNKKIATEFW